VLPQAQVVEGTFTDGPVATGTERVITQPLVVAGVVLFTTFIPAHWHLPQEAGPVTSDVLGARTGKSQKLLLRFGVNMFLLFDL